MQGPLQQENYLSEKIPEDSSVISSISSPSTFDTVEDYNLTPMQSLFKQIRYYKVSDWDESSQINFFNLVSHLFSEVCSSDKKNYSTIGGIVKIFISKVTLTNAQMYSSLTSAIDAIKMWNFFKMTPSAIQTCSFLASYIIEQMDENNFHELIMLFYFNLQLGIQMNLKTLQLINCSLRRFIYNRRVNKQQKIKEWDKIFQKQLGTLIINTINQSVKHIDANTFKIYLNCLIIIINNIDKDDDKNLSYLKQHFMCLPMIQFLCPQERDDNNEVAKEQFQQQRENLFLSASVCYFKTGSKMLFEAVKYMINCGTTTLMVNNLWNYLNPDNYSYSSQESLHNFSELLSYLKQKNKQQTRYCPMATKGCWVSKSIDKKISLFVLQCQITHPRMMCSDKSNIILRLQMESGIIEILVDQINKNTNKCALIVKKYNREELNKRKAGESVQLGYIQLCLLSLALQFKSQSKTVIFCRNQPLEIAHAWLGPVKNILVGVRSQDKSYRLAVKNITNFITLQGISYEQFIKDKLQIVQSIKVQVTQSKTSILRKLTSINQQDSQFSLLDYLQSDRDRAKKNKIGSKTLQIQRLRVSKNENYIAMVNKFDGKNKIGSFILNVLQSITQTKTIQKYLDVVLQEWLQFALSDRDLFEIQFLHGFSLFLNQSTEISNKLLEFTRSLNTQKKSRSRIEKALIQKIQLQFKSVLEDNTKIQDNLYEKQIISTVQAYLQNAQTFPKQDQAKCYKKMLNTLVFCLWRCVNDYSIKVNEQVLFRIQIFQNFKQEKDLNIEISNAQIIENALKLRIDAQKFQELSKITNLIMSKVLQKSDMESLVLQGLSMNLQFLLIILSNISINQKNYVPQILLQIFNQNYQNLSKLSIRAVAIQTIPQSQQIKICAILSQVFNLLPNLCLYSSSVSKQSDSINKQSKFYSIYVSNKLRCQNGFHKDTFYLLMCNYYLLGFQIGSFILKSKSFGFLTYMGYAYKFMNQYKDNMNWDQKDDILTIRDRIMITQIYACCLKFIFNNFNAKNIKKLYEFDVETQINSIVKLSDLCLPIYFVERPKNNKKLRNILEQILKFYILSGTSEQFPSHLLANLQADEYQKLFKLIKTEIDNKMPPKKDQRVYRDIFLMTLANSTQKFITVETALSQDYQSQQKYDQFLRVFEWYEIYNKIKYIHQLLRQRQVQPQISNYHVQHDLQGKLIQCFQDMLQRVNQKEYYQNLKYLIQNFISDRQQQKENPDRQQVKSYLPFIQLLLNQCKQINRNPKLRLTLPIKKQKKKDSNLFIFSNKQTNINFHTERTQINQQSQQIQPSIIKQKLFQKVINSNRTYFTQMYQSLTKDKNNILFAYYRMIQNLLIQQKINKAGSSTKYNQFQHYILDDWLSSENVKVMLKRDPVSILDNLIKGQIPRLHSSKKPYYHTLYAIKLAKSSLDLNKSLFFEVASQSESKYETMKQKGVILVPAFLITKSKIYQGSLEATSLSIKFYENSFIDKNAYQKLYANKSQERTYQELTVSKKSVQINVVEIVYCQKKKYLQKFPSLQIFAGNLSYFFVFNEEQSRKKLMTQVHIPIRQRSEEYAELVHELKQNWGRGWISNFQLITSVNNIAGRSFNDVSQYYIFPWTVTNFKGKMDAQFLKNKANFRDLNKPIGAQNPKKLQTVLNKYAMIVCDKLFNDLPYIYGSFYSNPGIVCNYLLRVNPFTTHHYQLQGNQFDLYDRLFTDLQDQYRSIYNSVFDNRELVPQFYSAPQFFRNRNKFNFAHNKSEVNKIDLSLKVPEWVVTGSAEQFVFRMRKALQCDIVSTKLGSWIDLIFGFKSEEAVAAEYHNLYVHELYTIKKNSKENQKTQNQLTRSQIQKKAHMIKQFGQVPRNIFGSYPSMKSNYHHVAQSIFSQSITIKQLQVTKSNKSERNNSQFNVIFDFYDSTLVISQRTKMVVMNTIEEVKKLEIQIEKQFVSLAIMGIKKTKNIIVFGVTANQNTIVYAITRGSKGSILTDKQSYTVQTTLKLSNYSRVNHIKIIGDNAVMARKSEIAILQVSKQQKQSTIATLIQKQSYLCSKKSICLHQSQIIMLQTYACLDLVISVDSSNLVNVFSISPQLILRSTFSLTVFKPCETIVKLLVHQMGVIVILTNLNQLVIYNIYGDLIQRVRLAYNHILSDLIFWDHTSSADIILSTKNGSLFQFDIFDLLPPTPNFLQLTTVDLKQKQKIQIIGNNMLIMHRFGRYWEIYFIQSLCQVKVMQCEEFSKKYVCKKILENCNRNNTYSNS